MPIALAIYLYIQFFSHSKAHGCMSWILSRRDKNQRYRKMLQYCHDCGLMKTFYRSRGLLIHHTRRLNKKTLKRERNFAPVEKIWPGIIKF